MNLSAYTVRPVFVTLAVLLVIVLWDFFGRVWSPLDRQPAADTNLSQMERLDAGRNYEIVERLDRWINPDRYQEQTAQSETDEDAERRRQQRREERERERQARLAPLPGSQDFDNFRLRIRAVFIRTPEGGEKQAFAIAEQQMTDSGDVSRIVLREQQEIGAYAVTRISTDSVSLRHTGEGQGVVNVLVFDPDAHRQQAALRELLGEPEPEPTDVVDTDEPEQQSQRQPAQQQQGEPEAVLELSEEELEALLEGRLIESSGEGGNNENSEIPSLSAEEQEQLLRELEGLSGN